MHCVSGNLGSLRRRTPLRPFGKNFLSVLKTPKTECRADRPLLNKRPGNGGTRRSAGTLCLRTVTFRSVLQTANLIRLSAIRLRRVRGGSNCNGNRKDRGVSKHIYWNGRPDPARFSVNDDNSDGWIPLRQYRRGDQLDELMAFLLTRFQSRRTLARFSRILVIWWRPLMAEMSLVISFCAGAPVKLEFHFRLNRAKHTMIYFSRGYLCFRYRADWYRPIRPWTAFDT